MSERPRHSRVQDPFSRVWRFFEAHAGAWRASRRESTAGFERRDTVRLEGAPWIVCYKLHAIRSTRVSAVELLASITIWPPTPAATAPEWRLACQREIRLNGYRGRWRESPYGRFADFWKTLENAGAVPREVRRLDRLSRRVLALSARRPGSRRRAAGRARRR